MDLITYLSKTLNITPEQATELASKMPGFDPAHGASTSAINSSLTMGPVSVVSAPPPAQPQMSMGPVSVGKVPNLEMDPSSVAVTKAPPRMGGLAGYLNVDQMPETVGAKAAEDIKLQTLPEQELDRMDRMTEWANAWINHDKRQVGFGGYEAEHTNPYNLSPGAILSTKRPAEYHGVAGTPIPMSPEKLKWAADAMKTREGAHVDSRDIALKSAKEGVNWATDAALAATAGMMSPEKKQLAADVMRGRLAQDKLNGDYGKDKVKPETNDGSGGSVTYTSRK